MYDDVVVDDDDDGGGGDWDDWDDHVGDDLVEDDENENE